MKASVLHFLIFEEITSAESNKLMRDESFYPQDMDDHDLHYRMKKLLGKVTGIYWIDYISDNEWGGTRENGVTKQWMLDANHKNSGILRDRHLDILSSPGKMEVRKCI